MLKLSELHASHQHLYLSLVLRGFNTPGTPLWLNLPPLVMKTLQWPTGQRLRCKVSSSGLVMTPLRQASAVRKTVPRKRTQAHQLRQNLAWQACLKGLRRSARTKGLVMRRKPRSEPDPSEPAADQMQIDKPMAIKLQSKGILMSENPLSSDAGADSDIDTETGKSPRPAETVKADEPDSSTAAAAATAAVIPLGMFRWSIKHLEIAFLTLLLVLLVLGIFVPMTIYAYRHVFMDEPGPRAIVVQNAGRVVSVSQSGGFITHALVETDLGYYALMDGVSLNKNEALTLETRSDKLRFLCDSQHRCLRLVADGQPE